jgi:hypothetical protein
MFCLLSFSTTTESVRSILLTTAESRRVAMDGQAEFALLSQGLQAMSCHLKGYQSGPGQLDRYWQDRSAS